MYFRNVSQTMSITINTVVGKLGVKPGECIELNEKIYPPLPSTLMKISEEEYFSFREGTKQHQKQVEKVQTENVQPDGHVDTKLDETHVDDSENPTMEQTIEEALKDPGIMDFVKSLLNKGVMEPPKDGEKVIEEITEHPKEEIKPQKALKVKEVKKADVELSIEEQITELKETWVQTKNARKKEKLAKQIKELQKQSEKLKSNKGDE